MSLDKNQLRHLKSIAHNRKPIVSVGQKGLSQNVIKESKTALHHHELVKIKVSSENREMRDRIINQLCDETGAECIQKIGGKAVFYLRNKKKPVIKFPE